MTPGRATKLGWQPGLLYEAHFTKGGPGWFVISATNLLVRLGDGTVQVVWLPRRHITFGREGRKNAQLLRPMC